jgi:hypothetical protein
MRSSPKGVFANKFRAVKLDYANLTVNMGRVDTSKIGLLVTVSSDREDQFFCPDWK